MSTMQLETRDGMDENTKQTGALLKPMYVPVGTSRNQVGREPKIIVWDTATMQTVKVLKGFHQRAVTLLVRGGPREDVGVAIFACRSYFVDRWRCNVDCR